MIDRNTVKYRVRYLSLAAMFVVERRRTEKALGFFPVYVWELVSSATSRSEAISWILAQGSAK